MSIINKNEELQFDPTQTTNGNGSVVIGHLSGPCADIIKSTRNGRKYSEQLWEKVFKDPITKEYFNCGGIFGELGHPIDREETDMSKIALCMPKPPTKKNGKLWADFDILDTPNGRILKTLCQYGYKMGISSRGSGDIITDYDGQEAVDPDTYQFTAFDAVLLPAVKEARLEFKESFNAQKSFKTALTESYNNSTEEEKKIMKETLDNLDIELDEELLNENDNVIVRLYVVDTISGRIVKGVRNAGSGINWIENEKENGNYQYALYYDRYIDGHKQDHIKLYESKTTSTIFHLLNLCEWVSTNNSTLFEEFVQSICEDINQETDDINNEVSNENEVVNNESLVEELQNALKEKQELESLVVSLQEQLSVRNAKEKEFKEKLDNSKKNLTKLSEDTKKAIALDAKVKKLDENLNKANKIILEKQEKHKRLQERLQDVKKENKRILNESKAKSAKLKLLKEELDTTSSKLTLSEENYINLQKDFELKKSTTQKQLTEAQEKVNKFKKVAKNAVNRYIESQAVRIGVTSNEIRNRLSESYTFDDIDNICEELQKYQLDINKLPFKTALTEGVRIKATTSTNESIRPVSDLSDDVDADLLHLAGL